MSKLKSTTRLSLIYFCSGLPALFYQLVWQRALYILYGVNIESITLIVMGFMFGLGMGSLLGGWLSKHFSRRLLLLFGLFELAIGVFGFFSLSLFHWVGLATVNASNVGILGFTFALVCLPTLLMGATLPLLTAYVVRQNPNVGHSVSILYFVNTLGSAMACFIAAAWAMPVLGQLGTVTFAASINILAGISALWLGSQPKPRQFELDLAIDDEGPYHRSQPLLALPMALLLSVFVGFISLSYKILWIRVYGFISGENATVFANVLGFYLIGLASGALWSRFYCTYVERISLLRVLAISLFLSGILGYLWIPGLAWAVQYTQYSNTLLSVAVIATLFGLNLPLICHSAVYPDNKAGKQLSYIYFANILGATLGTFVTGFIWMDSLSLGHIHLLLTGLSLLCAVVILSLMPAAPKKIAWIYLGAALLIGAFLIKTPVLFHFVYEKLMYKEIYSSKKPFNAVVENKNGIITVEDNTVFGDGVYDGRFNTNLVNDTNGIVRAYAIGAFHPHPEEVLMIGLSSGSWAQVIANHPKVKRLTIVEINPGYLQLIAKHPEVASLLKNPKVDIVIDDGRRWLRRHPDRQFDLVVMNTTWYWRNHTSQLLSAEFLQTVRKTLKAGGIFYYNTTNSLRALHTATDSFPYALRVLNFIAVSDSPIALDKKRWRSSLLSYSIDSQPVFDLSKRQYRKKLHKVLLTPMVSKEQFSLQIQAAPVITDDNMGSEWTG